MKKNINERKRNKKALAWLGEKKRNTRKRSRGE